MLETFVLRTAQKGLDARRARSEQRRRIFIYTEEADNAANKVRRREIIRYSSPSASLRG
jgi:hypothetical protein